MEATETTRSTAPRRRAWSSVTHRRPAKPVLWEAPEAQDGQRQLPKRADWRDLVEVLAGLEGSDSKLARRLGYTDGSRISEFRRGTDRKPSVKLCVLLANLYNYDPVALLRLGGHGDIAELLAGKLPQELRDAEERRQRDALDALRKARQILNEQYDRRMP